MKKICGPCSHCETGKKSIELDHGSAVCPYLYCMNGKRCGMYKRLKRRSRLAALIKSAAEKISKMLVH